MESKIKENVILVLKDQLIMKCTFKKQKDQHYLYSISLNTMLYE